MDLNPSLRRPRFTIRRLMIALPLIALGILFAAGINPLRRNPLHRALDGAIEACRIPTASFQATKTVTWVDQKMTLTPDKPALVAAPCVLKIAVVGRVVSTLTHLDTYGSLAKLAPDGRFEIHRRTFGSVQGSGRTVEPAEMTAILQILPTLPPSEADIPPGPTQDGRWSALVAVQQRAESRAFVIGFRDGKGAWMTRVYDKQHQPPAVVALLDKLGYWID